MILTINQRQVNNFKPVTHEASDQPVRFGWYGRPSVEGHSAPRPLAGPRQIALDAAAAPLTPRHAAQVLSTPAILPCSYYTTAPTL